MNAPAGLPNPFRQTIVTDPWQLSGVDVPEIHAQAFETCCAALDSVRVERRSSSVLLHGEAGSGKTHLLARLRRHWVGDSPNAVDPIHPEVVFIAVRLQTGPQRLWRHLRRSVAEDLLRVGDNGITQLERILLRRFAEIRRADADLLLWWDWLRQEYPNPVDLEQILDDLFNRLDQDIRLGRDLCKVLGHLLLQRHRRDARAWLRGDPLPGSVLEAMSLVVADEDEDQEDQAREVVVALCHLAGPTIPVVFCFDQIEALQVGPRDDAALFAFGQLVMSLFQETRNALLITCVQSAYIDRLKRSACVGSDPAIRDAAWARMAVYERSLNPLFWEEAVSLIEARMASLPELAKTRVAHPEPLWPLNASRLREEVGSGETARRILWLCAEMFDAASQRRPVPCESVEQYLARIWQERLERAVAGNGPGQSDAILTHSLPLLVHALGQPWTTGDSKLQDIDVLLEGPDGRVGISLCNHQDLRGLWRRLKRLPGHLQQKRLEKLVLLRDARLPILSSASKTQKYLTDLEAQGAQLIRPSVEALAALDALRGLLSDAMALDLANGGETVPPPTVRQWLAAHLPTILRDLLDEVASYPGIGGSRNDRGPFDRLVELLEERPVIVLEEAADQLSHPVAELEACVRDHVQHFGCLGGPPAVVFRLVPEEIESLGDEGEAEAVLSGS